MRKHPFHLHTIQLDLLVLVPQCFCVSTSRYLVEDILMEVNEFSFNLSVLGMLKENC